MNRNPCLSVLMAAALFVMSVGGVPAQPQWESVNSEGSLITVPPNGHLFTLSHNTLMCSTDRGASWTSASQDLTAMHITSLACNEAGDLLAGTWSQGIFRSIDEGKHWTSITPGFSGNNPVHSLAITSQGHIFADMGNSSNIGLYRSTDNGASWSKQRVGVGPRSMDCFLETRSGTLLIGLSLNLAEAGIFRSTDDGQTTWTHVFTTENQISYISALARGSGDCLLAGTNSTYGGSYPALYRSLDDGRTWASITSRLPPDLIDINAFVTRGDGEIFMGGRSSMERGKVFRSVDNGWTWEDVGRGLDASNVLALTPAPDGTLYAGAAWDGVFRSTYLVPVALSTFSVD